MFAFICALTIVSACDRATTLRNDGGPIELSGLIEGEKVTVSSEIGGIVAEIAVQEGDQVHAGDVLVRMDDTTLQAQLVEAQTRVKTARASRGLVAAGPRPGDVAAARAAVDSAEAVREGALEAWHNAIAARDNPQELDGRIAAIRAEMQVATYRVEQARLALQAAELKRNQTQEGSDERRVHDAQVLAAAADLAAAEAASAGAQSQLNQLYAIRDQPLAAEAQIRSAASQYHIAAADLRLAQARLTEMEAGPSDAEIAVADALVRQAQAALNVVLARQSLMTLSAPAGASTGRADAGSSAGEPAPISVVGEKMVQGGEAVSPGTPLLTLISLSPLHLTLYVPTDQIGRVSLGQSVEVRVDSFPAEVFRGQVVYISSRAEFTPHSLQTYDERVKAVFAVRVRLSNVDGRLKPGMPADGVFH